MRAPLHGLYKLGIITKIYQLQSGKMSLSCEREELTFLAALCYNWIDKETRMDRRLTVSEERRGADSIISRPSGQFYFANK